MEKFIEIEELENSKDGTIKYEFDDFIDGIKLAEPLHADLTAKNLGEFIEVKGYVTGIVKLECDRCLKEFDYELNFELDELFAKNTLLEDYRDETELKDGQFVTDLNGETKIDIYDLLYQSVIINLPNKKVCGINCNVGKFSTDENLVDPRLEVFKNIKVEPRDQKKYK